MAGIVVNQAQASQAALPHNFDIEGNYAYFEKKDGVEPNYYQLLLSKATNKIIIWDPYFDQKDHELFEHVNHDHVKVEILTICRDNQGKSDVQGLTRDIKNTLNHGGFPNCTVKVRGFKNNPPRTRNGKFFKFHDRFLVIDNVCYLVGASMKNQRTTDKSFGIYRVTNTDEVSFVNNNYRNCLNFFQTDVTGWQDSK